MTANPTCTAHPCPRNTGLVVQALKVHRVPVVVDCTSNMRQLVDAFKVLNLQSSSSSSSYPLRLRLLHGGGGQSIIQRPTEDSHK